MEMKWTWLDFGADGGVFRFLEQEEPVWAVELLRLCHPEAKELDLDHASALLFKAPPQPTSKPGESVTKRRKLRLGQTPKAAGGAARSWIAVAEEHIKAQIAEDVSNGYYLADIPWNDHELNWMGSNLSLHRADPMNLGPFRVTRFLPSADPAHGMLWTASLEGRNGYITPAHEKGPMVDLAILSDLDGWNPPEIKAFAQGEKPKLS